MEKWPSWMYEKPVDAKNEKNPSVDKNNNPDKQKEGSEENAKKMWNEVLSDAKKYVKLAEASWKKISPESWKQIDTAHAKFEAEVNEITSRDVWEKQKSELLAKASEKYTKEIESIVWTTEWSQSKWQEQFAKDTESQQKDYKKNLEDFSEKLKQMTLDAQSDIITKWLKQSKNASTEKEKEAKLSQKEASTGYPPDDWWMA